MLSQSLLWFVNLFIIVFSGIDSSTHGFTNIVSDKLMRFWRKPFTRKRLQSAGYNSSKQLVPVVYLFRRPKLQDNLSGLSGFSGSNIPGYVTIADDDISDQDDSSNSQGFDPIIKGINNAVQSLGLPNLSSSGQNSDSKDPSSSFDQSDRIPIGGSYDFKPFDGYKKQFGPSGTFGHEFLGHGHGHHFPFHYFPTGFHHGYEGFHGKSKSKVHFIPMPYPYPVVHMKHIKHHQDHHQHNDVSSWGWGILAAALLPILLGALLLPLGLLFGLSLLTLLAVAGGAGGGGTFIPVAPGGAAVPAGRRKRSISSELWDQRILDEIESFILDCIKNSNSL